MTQKRKNSLHTGREGRKALTTRGNADLRREEDIGADNMNGEVGIMDTAVIAMVNLYLKSLSSSERYIILKTVVSPNTEDEPEIKAHIDGAKLAELIDMAKAYLAELLNVKNASPSALRDVQPGEQPEEPAGSVFGVEMINTSQHGMINTVEYAYGAELVDGVDTEPAEPAEPAKRVVRVDDLDDDGPKYNPALEMSFDNLINKSWEVLYNLMRNLSGAEYVTHMPYEMAEMIVNCYEGIINNSSRQ